MWKDGWVDIRRDREIDGWVIHSSSDFYMVYRHELPSILKMVGYTRDEHRRLYRELDCDM